MSRECSEMASGREEVESDQDCLRGEDGVEQEREFIFYFGTRDVRSFFLWRRFDFRVGIGSDMSWES